jgi:hypothetical protein
MRGKIANFKSHPRLIISLILLLGLGSSIAIYFTAGKESEGGFGYVISDGQVYPVSPESSKKYMHDVEQFGGKMNVLSDKINRWFIGLWHGRNLAFTVAFLTLVVSSGIFFVSRYSPSDLETDSPVKNNGDGRTSDNHGA